jgi:hypothetical protein
MPLSPREIELGFWHPHVSGLMTDDGWLKRYVEPAVDADRDHLRIECTQLDDAKLQKRAVRAWCETLPRMGNVRRLWLTSRVTQPLFDAACQVPGLEGLWIKWSGASIKSLAALKHCPQLRHLYIGSSTQVADLRPLAHLPGLEVLELEAFTGVTDLSPLARLPRLEQLGYFGSIWTIVRIASLTPFARLETLRHLDIANLRATDVGSFRALAKLTRLEHMSMAAWWREEDVEYVRRRLPLWKWPARATVDE